MTEEVSKSTSSQTRYKLWVDILIFAAFLIAMDPRSSGLALHEWLTLSMLAAMTVHLLLNWDWIIQISSRFLGKLGGLNRVNYILNWLLFVDGFSL